MTAQILLAWRSQRSQTVVLPAAMTVFTLFVSQAMWEASKYCAVSLRTWSSCIRSAR
jgi:hypothetical protein